MSRIFTLLIFFTGYSGLIPAQNYAVGKRVIDFADEARANRQVSTEVYYPADTDGNNVPLASGIDKFPVVIFGHGFVIPGSSYEWLSDSLVKSGYVVALPSTESDLSPSHANFGEDLLFLCNRITSLNDSSSSFLYQRLIKKAAVAGHSMGGGCSFLAAGNSPVISAIFNFAAAETNPSAIAAAALVNKPALIFSGSADCIVPAATQLQMFTNIIGMCKTYINITGALHCQFANNNGTCSLGQLLSGCNSSSISPEIVFGKSVSLIIPFLDFYLKDICSRGNDYLAAYDALTGAEKIRTCDTFSECGVLPVNLQNFNGLLVNKTVNLKWKTASEENIEYFVVERSAGGIDFRPLQQVLPTGSLSVAAVYAAVDRYPYPGYSFYRLKMVNRDGRISFSGVIKIATPKQSLALVSLFPNPVKTSARVEFSSDRAQKVIVSIYNARGQTLMEESISLYSGLTKKNIVFKKLLTGVYILACKNEQGTIISSVEIIKE